MRTLAYISISLWLLISTLTACKSNKSSAPANMEALDSVQVTEYPKPASEQQTDSLKRMLDEQRRQRTSKP